LGIRTGLEVWAEKKKLLSQAGIELRPPSRTGPSLITTLTT